ncbi:MAG: cupredoxin domain-containing protein [Bacteroidetes bacterium]|nr:cupredoxin domain-containing protein [Bacteroidota bacterium]
MKYLIYIFCIVVILSCKKGDNTPQGDDEIWLLYKRFNPTVITIKKGTTLKFINKDNANHSVTSSVGAFDSGKIKSGNNFEHTFSDSASYSLYCRYHPDNLQEQVYITVK